MSNKLVAYFSASGVTAKVAETLAEDVYKRQVLLPAYLQLAPLPNWECCGLPMVNRYHGTLTPPRIAPSRPFKEKTEVSLLSLIHIQMCIRDRVFAVFMFVLDWRLGLSAVIITLLASLVAKYMNKVSFKEAVWRQNQSENLTDAVLSFAEGIGLSKVTICSEKNLTN